MAFKATAFKATAFKARLGAVLGFFFNGFLIDFWWILSSGEAPTLGFWAVDPVWSPPQAPGGKIKETNPRILKSQKNETPELKN